MQEKNYSKPKAEHITFYSEEEIAADMGPVGGVQQYDGVGDMGGDFGGISSSGPILGEEEEGVVD